MMRAVILILYRVIFMLVTSFFFTPIIEGNSEIRGNKLFLSSSLNNNIPYVGQEILLTYTLNFKDVAPKISNETTPVIQGFWAKEAIPERYIKSTQTSYHGELFRSAIVKQFRLVPIQSGKNTVSGYSIECTLPQENDLTYGKEAPETHIRITAPDVVISAHPLPKPFPDGFSGTIGNFQLELFANKQRLKAGELLSFTLKLTGKGNLLTLKLPDLQLPESFRHNPPDITISLPTNSTPSSGSITATINTWPQTAGDYKIPEQHIVTFNPATKQFYTLISKPIEITVTPATQETVTSRLLPSGSDQEPHINLSQLLIIIPLAFLFLIFCNILFIGIRKKINPAQGSTTDHAEHDTSASSLKQQIFLSLENAGIKSPGGLTRGELISAMQEIGLPEDIQSAIPAVFDSLDNILYSPTGAKETRTPESITAKVNIVLKALKTACTSR